MLLKITHSESAYPITPVEPLDNLGSGTILKFVYFLVVNNNKYLPYVVDIIIFGINPITPVEPLKATLYNRGVKLIARGPLVARKEPVTGQPSN